MELNNKNFNDKISEFLDGELSQEESKELFEYLAYHPELQEELRQYIVLKNLFHKELIEPPKSTKIHLYSKLNLQRSAIFLSFLLTLGSELRKFIFSPAFGAAIIGIALFTFSYFANQKENYPQHQISKSITKLAEHNENKNNITTPETDLKINYPIVKSANVQLQKHNENSSEPKIQYNNQDFNSSIENNQRIQNNTIAINQNIKNVDNSQFSSKNNLNFNKQNISNVALLSDYEISNFIERISLTINKSNSKSTINTNLEPLSNPLLNDYSISVGYLFDKKNSVGIEFGQENYSQKYSGNIDGKFADVTQVFTAQWYGVAYQYNFGEINSLFDLNPFSRFVVGGTSIGPIIKGILGVSYQANEKLTIQTGFEYSNLFYKFDNNWFFSDKYGIFYGVKIGF